MKTLRNSYLPSVMDFSFFGEVGKSFNETAEFSSIYDLIGQDVLYANPLNLLVFLDNHDTSRFFRNAKDASDYDRFKLAMPFY